MRTLIVDDRSTIVSMMQRILTRLDPDGIHNGTTDPAEAVRLATEESYDAAFLDIEMPEMSGIDLARKLQMLRPLINIIFITGYQEYMPNAFDLYASAYIMKPVTEKAVRSALLHLRNRPSVQTGQRIRVQCFGTFEVFADGVPVKFARAKSKELFAYLIDRRGAVCTNDMIIGNLWPDEGATQSRKSMARTAIAEMCSAFQQVGAEDVILRDKGGVCVNLTAVDCDFFHYLEGDPYAMHQFIGEYMTQYDFAAVTRANLQRKFFDE